MTIKSIDHINIATQKLSATRTFYVDILGLTEGYRPDFPFDGHWLYAGERAIVHLQQADGPVGPSQASALNHFAFEIADFDAIIARLDAHAIVYRLSTPPGTTIRQAFLKDPNGAVIELNQKA